ncbi:MAG: MazG nucleotide pyrophosphohydrolase domain protein [Parcubacteria group bacterium ADurb.Bin247]|jgi:NTP pyrophosphatase (non-canonical NTP hydrolase)|nr:MAG: MazG nucleotide pyrophosphohydrolase domain protein [Parcubacteria group bacterium ADurb.Bin247]
MTFEEYQNKSRETAIYPSLGSNFIYPTLGLVGESGEVAEKIKKILRDKEGVINEDSRKEIAKELGDVLWYLAQLSSELNLSLDDIAKMNIEKISSRKERNVLSGDGDNR